MLRFDATELRNWKYAEIWSF